MTELFEPSADVTLYLADSNAIVPKMKDWRIDAVITDPPYGIDFLGRRAWRRMRQLGYDPIEGDKETIDLSYLLDLDASLYVIFGGNFFELPLSRGWIVWDKQHGKKVDYGDCELIWTNLDKPTRIITHVWDGFLRDSDQGVKRLHPAQKPTGLMMRLIEDHTNPGDVVLDPYMGSGTTGVACARLGRRFIGVEKDRRYHEIATTRISEEQMQIKLPI